MNEELKNTATLHAGFVSSFGCNSTLFLIGDWKVPKTRRQECLRHVAQAFQPAGSGIFPDASPRGAESAAQEQCQAAPFSLCLLPSAFSRP